MNCDTFPDVLDRTTATTHGGKLQFILECESINAIIGLKANGKIGGQLRQLRDRYDDPAMRAEISAKNKGRFTGRFRSEHRKPESLTNVHAVPSNGDLRRNLYVLGLPFDLTKSEFIKIFETYGTVSHAVILATLDSVSRRRGFIVMSAHQEAKTAMDMLSRTQIKGHMLDVSWAVVQRSQGFLDGADRSMMLSISTPSVPEPDGLCLIPGGPEDPIQNHWELTHVPTSKLLVSNLSTILFTQVSDLHPLFYPFGPIKDIKIVGSSPAGPLNTTITAMVDYVNVSSAQEAKVALQFQLYAGHPIEVHHIRDANTLTHTGSSPFLSGSLLGHEKSSDIGLNPFAIPFNMDSRFPMGGQMFDSRYSAVTPSGLPSDAPLAPQPFLAPIRSNIMDAISRSSSATSSTWSHDGRPLRHPRTQHLSLSRSNTYTSYA